MAQEQPKTDPRMKCPDCKEPDLLDISALVLVRLIQEPDGDFQTDEDEAESGGHYWDDDNYVHCCACGWRGKVGQLLEGGKPRKEV